MVTAKSTDHCLESSTAHNAIIAALVGHDTDVGHRLVTQGLAAVLGVVAKNDVFAGAGRAHRDGIGSHATVNHLVTQIGSRIEFANDDAVVPTSGRYRINRVEISDAGFGVEADNGIVTGYEAACLAAQLNFSRRCSSIEPCYLTKAGRHGTLAGCGNFNGVRTDAPQCHRETFAQANGVCPAERQLDVLHRAQQAVLGGGVVVDLAVVPQYQFVAVNRGDFVGAQATHDHLAAVTRANEVVAPTVRSNRFDLQHQVHCRCGCRCRAVNFTVVTHQNVVAGVSAAYQFAADRIVARAVHQNHITAHTAEHDVEAQVSPTQGRLDRDRIGAAGSFFGIECDEIGHATKDIKINLRVVTSHKTPTSTSPLLRCSGHSRQSGHGDGTNGFTQVVREDIDDIRTKASNHCLVAITQIDRIVATLIDGCGLHLAQDTAVGSIKINLAVVANDQVVAILGGDGVIPHTADDEFAAVGHDDLVVAAQAVAGLRAFHLQHAVGRVRGSHRRGAGDFAVVAQNDVFAAGLPTGHRAG